MKPVVYNQRYQNPGIAKNFDYDSILIGSSMSDNFDTLWFDEKFECKTMKLTYEGVRTGNMGYMLKFAHESRPLEKVFIGLDLDPLFDTYGNYYFPLPTYLYDRNLPNNVSYLLNKSVIFDSIPKMITSNLNNTMTPLNLVYDWSGYNTFSQEKALSSVWWDMDGVKNEKIDTEAYVTNVTQNLDENIIPYIKEHPETEYYIFYPPSSVLWWNMKVYQQNLDEILEVVQLSAEKLLIYPNVHLAAFQHELEITGNVDNYKDYNHYKSEVNKYMLDHLLDEKYQITSENLEEHINQIRTMTLEYDFSELESKTD